MTAPEETPPGLARPNGPLSIGGAAREDATRPMKRALDRIREDLNDDDLDSTARTHLRLLAARLRASKGRHRDDLPEGD